MDAVHVLALQEDLELGGRRRDAAGFAGAGDNAPSEPEQRTAGFDIVARAVRN